VWRWLDPSVPRPRAQRRLRAVVLASTVTLGAGAVVAGVGDAPTGSSAATGAGAPAPERTASVRPLVATPGMAPVITRVDTTDPVVFVTIDDGFTRTPEMITTLEELDMPVTLFLVDHALQDGAVFFRSLPDAPVEAHTRTHPNLRSLPEAVQRAEICGNADTIASTFGRRPGLFRPPEGSYDATTRRAAAACGMTAVVLWEEVVDQGEIQFRTVRRFRPGDIVLLHFRPELPDDLRMLARRLDAAGLRAARLEDYLLPPSPPG
jgi:peptidoglycan/xylan/chitin deacetylase (PgdA/CDA1 family)